MNEHATPAITPSALCGRGTGLIVCAIFAALWANWARPLLMGSPADWMWAAAAIVAVVSGALLLAGVSMIRRGRRLSQVTGTGDTAPRRMRSGFKLVLIAEIVALNIAAYFLISHHMAQYLAPAIAVVVGLHFLPLAKIFRAPHFFATAVVMTLAGVLAAVAMATGSPVVTANGIVDLVCAAALWGTGFATWRRTHKATAVGAAAAMTSFT
ncbi:MAG: hypothetical protein ACREPH_07840 [Rhodanobacteraceae bacterium]